ncbi:carbohydrate-binding protein [Nocardia jejuensis]|uniref:carbohydrate-binding protein n=1 Tax=Nocardia jejuensis TaxID=328049 RepID=UPI00082FDBCA|nr:carbohydrate-binding protein [Nocardia jejuensis]
MTVATAAPASAQLAITSAPVYYADTTYTVTFPAADADAMVAQYGQNTFVLGATNTTRTFTVWSPPVTYTAGQDVTFQWTPADVTPTMPGSAPGVWNLSVEEAHVVSTPVGPLVVTVVAAPVVAAWQQGATYQVGDVVTYNGAEYRCIQAHTAHAPNWTPDLTPALWQKL